MTDSELAFTHTKSKTYNTKLITSLQEYFDYVNHLQSSWDSGVMWYRGVSKSRYALTPGIYRRGIWNYDGAEANELFYESIRQAQAFALQRDNKLSEWEWLYLMQHHGLPTRLLDWTEGSLIGLYFAMRDIPEVSTPCVWVLDPFWVNQESAGVDVIFETYGLTQSDEDKPADRYIKDHPDLPQFPISTLPTYFNPRLSAQRSCFTVHGKKKNGMESLFRKSDSPRLAQLRIRTQSAEVIRNEIVRAGISESTLFPDLEGLARDLKDRYRLS